MSLFPTTHTVSVYHLSMNPSTHVENYSGTASLTNLKVTIQPAGMDILAVYPGLSAFQTYKMYVWDAVTIKNGDKVTDGTSTWYVRGIAQVQDYPFHYHQAVVLEKAVS